LQSSGEESFAIKAERNTGFLDAVRGIT